MKIINTLILVLILSIQVSGNPFLKKKNDSTANTSAIENRNDTKSITGSTFIEKIKSSQRILKERLTSYFDEVKNDNYYYIFIALLTSLIYGILHALGPGHGKITLSSYVLARSVTTGRTIWMGFMAGFAHALTSLLIISFIILVFETSILRNFEFVQKNLVTISFSMVSIIGFFILAKFIKNKITGSTEEDDIPVSKIKTVPVIISAGIIPCPGAAIILIFSYTMGIYFLGILCVITMSMGMGLTIGAAAVTTSLIKKSGTGLTKKFTGTHLLHDILVIIGGLSLLFIGLSYIISS